MFYGGNLGSVWPDYNEFEKLETALNGASYSTMISWILMEDAPMHTDTGNGKNTVKGKIDTLDYQILADWKNPTGNYLTARFDKPKYDYTYLIYFEVIDGEVPSENAIEFTYREDSENITKIYEPATDKNVRARSTAEYDGQHAPSFAGFTNIGRINGSNESNSNRTVKFFYIRSANRVVFNDGIYVDGGSENLDVVLPQYTNRGRFGESDLIQIEASVANANDFEPPKTDGFVFAGWYANPECTGDVFDFDKNVMTEQGIQLYAKWIRKQYRVFLHILEEDQDETLRWVKENQKTSFRVDLGEKIEGISAVARDDHELVGWYSDPGLTNPFNCEVYDINDSTTVSYNKTESTERDKFGREIGETNSDAERFWINRKIDLYAKWRSKLTGAEGIGIEYDVNLGNGKADLEVVTDDTLYKDEAMAEVLNNTATPPEGMHFDSWMLQKWNKESGKFEDTSITFRQGNTFTVSRVNARVTENAGSTAEKPSYTYTLRLKAVYKANKNDDIELTRIVYDGNGGKSDGVERITYPNLPLNTAVTVSDHNFKRDGYKLVGWSYTNIEGKTVTVKAGDVVGVDNLKPDYDNTLYVIWEEDPEPTPDPYPDPRSRSRPGPRSRSRPGPRSQSRPGSDTRSRSNT